jgi:hypothetical protein
MSDLRTRIVEEARSWIGTPFVHEQRVKGRGVDCATILAEVYERYIGQKAELPHYDVQWNEHCDDEPYLKGLLQYCVEVSPWRNHEQVPDGYSLYPKATGFKLESWDACPPLPGDIGLWKFGRAWAHCTIVIAWPIVLNPLMNGVVSEEMAQTVGSISRFGGRMRLMRPKIFLQG